MLKTSYVANFHRFCPGFKALWTRCSNNLIIILYKEPVVTTLCCCHFVFFFAYVIGQISTYFLVQWAMSRERLKTPGLDELWTGSGKCCIGVEKHIISIGKAGLSRDLCWLAYLLADFAEQSINSDKPVTACCVPHSAPNNRRVTSASRKCGTSPLDVHSSNFSSSCVSENATDDSLSAAATLPKFTRLR